MNFNLRAKPRKNNALAKKNGFTNLISSRQTNPDYESVAKTTVSNPVLTSAIIACIMMTANVEPVFAEISGLTPCISSNAYAKRKKQEIKELNKRLKKYEP